MKSKASRGGTGSGEYFAHGVFKSPYGMVVPGNKTAVTVHGTRLFAPTLPAKAVFASPRQQADAISNPACHTD